MSTNSAASPAMGALPKKSIIGYGFGDIAYQMIMQVQSVLVLYFLYNYSGVDGVTIGLIVMVAGFWDAANDPMMGAIVDRTNSKLGKARPYIFFGSIPLAIFIIALFFIPMDMPVIGKAIWIAIAYVGYGTCRTLVSIPYGTMMVRLTDSRDERMRLARAKSLMGVFGVLVVPVAYTVFASGQADEANRIVILVAAFAALYVLFNFIVFATTKEINRPTDSIKLNPFKGIAAVVKNKYWRRLTLTSIAYGIQQAITTNIILFYLTSKFQQPEMFMPVMATTFVGMILGAVTAKKIESKVGMRKLALLGSVIALAGCLIRVALFDANIWVMVVGFAIAQFGFAYYMLTTAPFLADVVEYGELTQGVRVESISSSSRTFADKIATTIVVSSISILLELSGFIDATSAGTDLMNIEQPQSALDMMFVLSAVVPVVMALVMIVVLTKFNVRQDVDKLRAEKAKVTKE